MRFPSTILAVVLCLGCSSDELAENPPQQSGSEAPLTESESSSPEVTTMPDACECFTAEDASEILGVAATRYEPPVECAYLEEGIGKRTSKKLTAFLYCPALQGRNWEELSQEQLIGQIRQSMMGGEFVKAEPGIGRRALIFTMKMGNKTGVFVHVGTGIQYRDEKGVGGELVVEGHAMNYPDGEIPIDAALATARLVMNKLAATL